MCIFSHVWLLVTPWTVACQAPLFLGFSKEEYWSGLPFPSPVDLPDPGIEPVSFVSPTLEKQILGRTPGRTAKWDSDSKVIIQFNSPSCRLTIEAMWEWWQESLFMCTYYVPYSILSVLYFQFLIFTRVAQNYRGGEEDSAEPDLVDLFSSSIHGFPLWTYLLGFSFFISLLNVPHSFPLSSTGYFQVLCLVLCNVNLLNRWY